MCTHFGMEIFRNVGFRIRFRFRAMIFVSIGSLKFAVKINKII